MPGRLRHRRSCTGHRMGRSRSSSCTGPNWEELMTTVRVRLMASLVLAPMMSIAAQQPAADPARGHIIFDAQCARCHGIGGNGGMGADLRRPTLRHAPDDSALALVIENGIPERGMPASWQLSPDEIRSVGAYVRSLGRVARAAVTGDSARGSALFVGKGHCQSCHM